MENQPASASGTAPAVVSSHGSEWIACAEKTPTLNDANNLGEVWWWIPRLASYGPQRDHWIEGEDATHWMRCGDGYADDDHRPSPPNVQDEPRPWLARAVLLGARIVTAMVVGSSALFGSLSVGEIT